MSSIAKVSCFILLMSSFWAPQSSAADGILEINQACAADGGCFSGDAAGFPITISAPGSYVLTGNLSIEGENTRAIEITTSNVTLDLNGFEIAGPNTCSGTPVTSCAHAADGEGIYGNGLFNIEIRNGTIRGMGGDGIKLDNGSQDRVIGMRVTESGQRGIYVTQNALVTDCLIFRNRFDGIYTAAAALITDNQVNGNGSTGISTGSQSLISGNLVYLNASDGIKTVYGISVVGNSIRSNGGNGINSVNANSNYSQNVIEENSGATVVQGVEFGTNICNGNTTCP